MGMFSYKQFLPTKTHTHTHNNNNKNPGHEGNTVLLQRYKQETTILWKGGSCQYGGITGIEAQAGIKTAGRNINNLRYEDDTTHMKESEEELKPLDESQSGEWKSWLKAQHPENEDHGIWSITSWEIDGETVETVSDFILGGSKITADGDCSHEIKICLLLGRNYDQPLALKC